MKYYRHNEMVNSLYRSFKQFNWWAIEPNVQCEGEGGTNKSKHVGILNNKNNIKYMDTVLTWLLFDDCYNFEINEFHLVQFNMSLLSNFKVD